MENEYTTNVSDGVSEEEKELGKTITMTSRILADNGTPNIILAHTEQTLIVAKHMSFDDVVNAFMYYLYKDVKTHERRLNVAIAMVHLLEKFREEED